MSESASRAITVLLQRRRERDESERKVCYSGYDIFWPDGHPVGVGLSRFCQLGTRLLLGRGKDYERALIQVFLYPVAGLEANLTRPGPGVRCRRFYGLRQRDEVQLHFFNGTPTDVVFDLHRDDPRVLRWLHAELIEIGIPFWFDLASRMLSEGPGIIHAPA